MGSDIRISPEIAREIRRISGYEAKEVAKELGIDVDQFLEIEETGKFTLEQIKKLADIYMVPIVVFFSESPLELPKLVDYRLNREKKLKPEVFVAIRRARYLSEQIKDISEKRSKIPEITISSPYEMAKELRKHLKVEVGKGKTQREILDLYKDAVENELNIIVIEYPIGEDVRAFSIYSDLAIIVLNESDEPSVKLFSLFHELAHIIKKESGICSIEIENEEEVERFCNEFSAEFLVPEEDLRRYIGSVELKDEEIRRISKKYGVSVQVIMLRLFNLGLISKERYQKFREKFDEKKLRKGWKDWDRTYENRSGKLVISEVRKAYRDGKLSFYEAMKVLDVKLKYAEKILE